MRLASFALSTSQLMTRAPFVGFVLYLRCSTDRVRMSSLIPIYGTPSNDPGLTWEYRRYCFLALKFFQPAFIRSHTPPLIQTHSVCLHFITIFTLSPIVRKSVSLCVGVFCRELPVYGKSAALSAPRMKFMVHTMSTVCGYRAYS